MLYFQRKELELYRDPEFNKPRRDRAAESRAQNLCDKIMHTGVAVLSAPSNSRPMGTKWEKGPFKTRLSVRHERCSDSANTFPITIYSDCKRASVMTYSRPPRNDLPFSLTIEIQLFLKVTKYRSRTREANRKSALDICSALGIWIIRGDCSCDRVMVHTWSAN